MPDQECSNEIDERVRRGSAALALAVAFVLHNLEEGLAYPLMRDGIFRRLASRGVLWWSPEPAGFQLLLAVLTVAGLLLGAWAGRGPPAPGKRLVLQMFAWILLANIAVPHVPGAILLGGYAPGVATAVTLNLAAGLFALKRLRPQAT
jgi:hypothetical protein